MSTLPMHCRRCGSIFAFPMSEAVYPCDACDALHERPQMPQDTFDGLNRANELRADKDYAQALRVYEDVLQRCRTSHEALWGKVLCKYGVEYVNDSATHQRKPTLHFLQRKLILLEGDFIRACRNAPDEIAAQYREDAQYIAGIQQELLRSADSWDEYDVFLCYKGSAPDGNGKAKEYEHAFRLCRHLEKHGFRVFFAHETLKRRAGERFEAGIFSALHSTKVMLVICSDPANLSTAWVHSEWSRFLERYNDGENCTLIPLLYDDCKADSLPSGMSNLEAIEMSDPEAYDALKDNLKRYVQPEARQAAEAHVDAAEADALARIQYLLEAARWEEAEKSADDLMGDRPRCAQAYLCKLLATRKLMDPEQLGQMTTAFEDDLHWKKALRWSKDDERKELEELLKKSLEARAQKRLAEEQRIAEEKSRVEDARRTEEIQRDYWSALIRNTDSSLKSGAWGIAAHSAQSMIDHRPFDYHGYLYIILARHQLSEPAKLAECLDTFEQSTEWRKLLDCAPQEERSWLKEYLKHSLALRTAETEKRKIEDHVPRSPLAPQFPDVNRLSPNRLEAGEAKTIRIVEEGARLLRERKWQEAAKLAEQLPDGTDKYLLQLQAKYRVPRIADFEKSKKPFAADPLWEKLLLRLDPIKRKDMQSLRNAAFKRIRRRSFVSYVLVLLVSLVAFIYGIAVTTTLFPHTGAVILSEAAFLLALVTLCGNRYFRKGTRIARVILVLLVAAGVALLIALQPVHQLQDHFVDIALILTVLTILINTRAMKLMHSIVGGVAAVTEIWFLLHIGLVKLNSIWELSWLRIIGSIVTWGLSGVLVLLLGFVFVADWEDYHLRRQYGMPTRTRRI